MKKDGITYHELRDLLLELGFRETAPASFEHQVSKTFEGTVQNGMVILDKRVLIPDGTRVRVTILAEAGKPTLLGLLGLAGTVNDMPPDFAAEHDHYIHGTPKRNREK